MSQALNAWLVKHSKKVKDLLPFELSFFLVEGENEMPLGRCIHCWILPLDVVHSSVIFISHETKGRKVVFKADVTVAEIECTECWSDTALSNCHCLGFYCFNLTHRISVYLQYRKRSGLVKL